MVVKFEISHVEGDVLTEALRREGIFFSAFKSSPFLTVPPLFINVYIKIIESEEPKVMFYCGERADFSKFDQTWQLFIETI
jgi:hypothetical protein